MSEERRLSDSKVLEAALQEKLFIDKQKTYSYEEIKDFAKQELGNGYSNGKVAGIISQFVNSNKLVRIERGKYAIVDVDSKINIKSLVKDTLTTAIEEIYNKLGKIAVLELSDDDFKDLCKVREITNNIQQDLSCL